MLIDGCRLMVVLISFCSQREAELGDHLSALGLQDQGMIIVTTIRMIIMKTIRIIIMTTMRIIIMTTIRIIIMTTSRYGHNGNNRDNCHL